MSPPLDFFSFRSFSLSLCNTHVCTHTTPHANTYTHTNTHTHTHTHTLTHTALPPPLLLSPLSDQSTARRMAQLNTMGHDRSDLRCLFLATPGISKRPT